MTDQTREAFEAWVLTHGGSVDRVTPGEYRSAQTECGWIAWQAATLKANVELDAARAAVEVMQKALREMSHAHFNPNWFTNGSAGATAQFVMWREKGNEAAAAIRQGGDACQ